jgi:predicted lipid-binding transport protein (Tim44 family)
MANPPGEPGQAGQMGMPQSAADDSAVDLQTGRFPGPTGRADEHLFHLRQIAADQDRILDLDQQEVDGIVAALKDRTPAELPGVHTSAIRQVDPGFEDEAFRAIARETFYKVREARKLQNPEESAELLSPQMQRELEDAIAGDVASHRHHVMPFLWIKDAVIADAQVIDGQEQIDVRFSISAGEEDVDDRTSQVLDGDSIERSWEERWRFRRDPGSDTSASDQRHQITLDPADQWMFAHRGWIVTQIERLPPG